MYKNKNKIFSFFNKRKLVSAVLAIVLVLSMVPILSLQQISASADELVNTVGSQIDGQFINNGIIVDSTANNETNLDNNNTNIIADNEIVVNDEINSSNNIYGFSTDDTEYAITFMDNGSRFATQYVKAGEYASDKPHPTKEGYIFNCWVKTDGSPFDFENTKIYSDITLYSTFNKVPMYTVTVNPSGGIVDENKLTNWSKTITTSGDIYNKDFLEGTLYSDIENEWADALSAPAGTWVDRGWSPSSDGKLTKATTFTKLWSTNLVFSPTAGEVDIYNASGFKIDNIVNIYYGSLFQFRLSTNELYKIEHVYWGNKGALEIKPDSTGLYQTPPIKDFSIVIIETSEVQTYKTTFDLNNGILDTDSIAKIKSKGWNQNDDGTYYKNQPKGKNYTDIISEWSDCVPSAEDETAYVFDKWTPESGTLENDEKFIANYKEYIPPTTCTVTGKVTDNKNVPINGASVLFIMASDSNTTIDASTDASGLFTLKEVPKNTQGTLSAIYDGYDSSFEQRIFDKDTYVEISLKQTDPSSIFANISLEEGDITESEKSFLRKNGWQEYSDYTTNNYWQKSFKIDSYWSSILSEWSDITPTKENYTFTKWDKLEDDKLTEENDVCTALYKEKTTQIQAFMYLDGAKLGSSDTEILSEKDWLSSADGYTWYKYFDDGSLWQDVKSDWNNITPVKFGYDFIGWSKPDAEVLKANDNTCYALFTNVGPTTTCSVNGKVVDNDDTPVEGAIVSFATESLYNSISSTSTSVSTDADGNYVLQNVPVNQAGIFAISKTGFETYSITKTFTGDTTLDPIPLSPSFPTKITATMELAWGDILDADKEKLKNLGWEEYYSEVIGSYWMKNYDKDTLWGVIKSDWANIIPVKDGYTFSNWSRDDNEKLSSDSESNCFACYTENPAPVDPSSDQSVAPGSADSNFSSSSYAGSVSSSASSTGDSAAILLVLSFITLFFGAFTCRRILRKNN